MSGRGKGWKSKKKAAPRPEARAVSAPMGALPAQRNGMQHGQTPVRVARPQYDPKGSHLQPTDPKSAGRAHANAKAFTQARAAYNFVPLSRHVFIPPWHGHVSHDFPLQGGVSGRFEIEIKAETPLLVGDERGPGAHRAASSVTFFSLPDGTPAIPSTSLKGMVRSVVEIAGFGRLRHVNDSRFGVRDLTPTTRYYTRLVTHAAREASGVVAARALTRAGWLWFEGERWHLRPCQYVRLTLRAQHVAEGSDHLERFGYKADRMVPDRKKPGQEKPQAITGFVDRYAALAEALKKAGGAQEGTFAGGATVTFRPTGHVNVFSHGANPTRLKMRLATNLNGAGAEPLAEGFQRGLVVFTGSIKSKKREFIFYDDPADGAPASFPVDPKVMADFVAIHSPQTKAAGEAAQPNTNAWAFWQQKLQERAIGLGVPHAPGIPVFYITEQDRRDRENGLAPSGYADVDAPPADSVVARLGLAQMFKMAADYSVREMIANRSSAHEPGGAPDLADLLFGTVADDAGGGLRGRVSISHAPFEGTWKGILSFRKRLTAPKPTFYPNYVEQDSGVDNRVPRPTHRDDVPYNTYMRAAKPSGDDIEYMDAKAPEPPVIRGWKRYPARDYFDGQDEPPANQDAGDKTLSLLAPIKAGGTFRATVRFHNLLPAELGALVWALTLGEHGGDPAASPRCHGLGMGKAFGMGQVSVRILETGVDLRPNDVAEAGRSDASALVEAMEAFQNTMEDWYADATDDRRGAAWQRSDQIGMLRTMADRGHRPPADGYWPMILRTTGVQVNEFRDAKAAGYVLPRPKKQAHGIPRS